MEKKHKKYGVITVGLIFVLYLFIAIPPIPVETILTAQWISSLESHYPDPEGDFFLPFELGGRFGYVDPSGRFTINREKEGNISLSKDRWAEYGNQPETIEVRDSQNRRLFTIEQGGGYPLFLDGETYLINSEQTALSQVDEEGNIRWTHDFATPLTAIDAAQGMVLTGALDGTVELLDGEGRLVFPPFEPGGSRYSVILGCRISRDGTKLAVVSGLDPQRFLLLERSGDAYNPIYHEFLTGGFRREVHLAFIDDDRRVVFEREGGLGIYTISTRNSLYLPLEGDVYALDGSGEDGLLFLITAEGMRQKNLVAIRLPGVLTLNAPFTSEIAFLGRQGPRLFIGGGSTLAAFDLDKR
ncbi:MAG: WD40 repeat domain-containing protein [Spirochaetaceae bacterium]|nr:WD40 repeat domain-containing protein [Spirochaetaceae bacterium]